MKHKSCETCRYFDQDKRTKAVIIPPGHVISEEQYGALVAAGQIAPGTKGVIRGIEVSMCTVFPKHESVHTDHYCGQHRGPMFDA